MTVTPNPTIREYVAREQARARRERWEQLLLSQIRALKLPEPEREYRFADRRWRLDFAWPTAILAPGHWRLAVEVEGITPAGGRHQRMRGFEEDAAKYLAAAVLGWLVLRVTPRQVKNGDAVRAIEALL